jgi:magnesium-transporting ATPase (P-type)
MRKLNFLKAIVDFVWIMSFITIPPLITFFGYVLISDKPLDIPIKLNGLEIEVKDLQTKVLLIFIVLAALLIFYCVFLFRKTLSSFQRKKIFDLDVIKNFNRIGILLIISALLSGIPAFIIKLLKKEVSFELGLNSFVMLFCLGLFFMVLSEVFMIAKKQKEENELTI